MMKLQFILLTFEAVTALLILISVGVKLYSRMKK
jgi:hypothetical protein